MPDGRKGKKKKKIPKHKLKLRKASGKARGREKKTTQKKGARTKYGEVSRLGSRTIIHKRKRVKKKKK